MRWLAGLWWRLRSIGRRAELDRGLNEELQFHVEQQTAKNLRAGMAPDEARRRALVLFGALERTKEDVRDEIRASRLEDVARDVRHAGRTLRRTPGVTTVAILTLAIGIGATTALFTAVNGQMLQSVAVPEPERLVRLAAAGENHMRRSSSDYGFLAPHEGEQVRASFSYAAYEQMRATNRTLTDLAAFAPLGGVNMVVDGVAEIAPGYLVSGSFFRVLRVPMAAGRALTADDDRPDAAPAAVISHSLWRRRFGSSPAAVGATVRMNNTPVTIVGVTAASYTGILRLGDAAPDVTIPLSVDRVLNPSEAARYAEPTRWWLLAVGRLKPGATLEQVVGNLEGPFHQAARSGMDQYMAGLSPEQLRLSENQRRGDAVPRLVVRPAARGMYDTDNNMRRSAALLSAVVTILLLIVCVNVANLLLCRGATRAREMAVRLSMGASRWRLVRQVLTESLLLAGAGGAGGIAVAYWGKSLLPFGQNAAIDARVLAFVAGVSVLAGLLFGTVPAFRTTSVELAGAMKESGRSLTHRMWVSKGLLVVQVALSLVLLIGAGLFLRTLHNLRGVDIGFDAGNLLMFRITPQANGYEPARIARVYERAEAALAAVAGVRSAAFTRMTLFSGGTSTTDISIQGKTGNRGTYVMNVSPSFFDTLGIPLLHGRGFTAHDLARPRLWRSSTRQRRAGSFPARIRSAGASVTRRSGRETWKSSVC